MNSYLLNLVKLQDSYCILNENRKKLCELKKFIILKQIKKEFNTCKDKYVEIKNQLSDVKNKHDEIDKQMNLKKKEIEEKKYILYNDLGSNIKLIEKVQKEISRLEEEALHIEQAFENLIEEENSINECNDELKKRMAKLKNDFDFEKSSVSEKINEVNDNIVNAENTIKKIEEMLPEEWLNLYVNLKKTKSEPIAEVENNICTGCKIGVSAIVASKLKKGNEIVYCDNCGRILFLRDK